MPELPFQATPDEAVHEQTLQPVEAAGADVRAHAIEAEQVGGSVRGAFHVGGYPQRRLVIVVRVELLRHRHDEPAPRGGSIDHGGVVEAQNVQEPEPLLEPVDEVLGIRGPIVREALEVGVEVGSGIGQEAGARNEPPEAFRDADRVVVVVVFEEGRVAAAEVRSRVGRQRLAEQRVGARHVIRGGPVDLLAELLDHLRGKADVAVVHPAAAQVVDVPRIQGQGLQVPGRRHLTDAADLEHPGILSPGLHVSEALPHPGRPGLHAHDREGQDLRSVGGRDDLGDDGTLLDGRHLERGEAALRAKGRRQAGQPGDEAGAADGVVRWVGQRGEGLGVAEPVEDGLGDGAASVDEGVDGLRDLLRRLLVDLDGRGGLLVGYHADGPRRIERQLTKSGGLR